MKTKKQLPAIFAIAFFTILLLSTFLVTAQNTIVSGIVKDEKGPLQGASVTLKSNTKIGATTDENGRYNLTVPAGSVLVFTFKGYKLSEMPVNGRTAVDAVLQAETDILNDVVIVGYTSKQRSQISSSVSIVSGKELNDVTSSNITSLLQGKAPGVVVSNSSGNPNTNSNIVIRGSSSISAGSEPLTVVDGIIGGSANPADVESVTVLKDASATGLYGSRAANGVIIITTKSGRAGKTRVTVNANTGFNKVTMGNFRVMNSQEVYDYDKSFFTPADFARERPTSLLQTNTNWQDLTYRTGITKDYEVSVSGGSEKTQFYISGIYYNEEGTVRHTGIERFNIRTNLTHKINDKLKLSVRINGSNRTNENEASGNYGAISAAVNNMPFDNPYNADGAIKIGTEPGWVGREQDNFLHGWQYNFDKGRALSVDGDLNLDYYITPNITFSTYNRGSYSNSKGQLYYDVRSKAGKGLGELTNNYSYGNKLITSNRLSYDKKFGNHSLNAIIVAEAEKNYVDNNSLYGSNITPGLHVMEAAANILRPSSSPGSTSENAFTKGLAQVDYNYNNRYFLIASFINESSSRFGKNNRAANFYTLGASWILSNENFMRTQTVFNQLKIRGSYGSTGNANIGDYQARGLYSFTSQYGGNPAAIPYQIPNDDLTWEKAQSTDVGLDIGLFNRISLNVDWYEKTTKGLLLNVPLPTTSGYSSVIQNVGSVKNTGIELNLTTKNIDGQDFKWETRFNIAFNKNKVLVLNQGKDITTGDMRVSVGRDLYTWYFRKWAGVNPANGDPLWEQITSDASGNKTVSTTNNYNLATLQFTGKATPDYTGGINNVFTYKSISLSAFANFVHGGLVYDQTFLGSDGAYQTYNEAVLQSGQKRWEKAGDIATHPKAVYGGNLNSNKPSSRFLQDGSYIRLRNVTLGYDLPTAFINKIHIKNIRVYASGDNLWTGTKFLGMDPEVALSAGNGATIGNSGSSYKYPISKKVLFGVNIEF
ncbi:MAG: SusC/RagA family TonB-linked outer membrane protein [Chitinophagaceae bacterium]